MAPYVGARRRQQLIAPQGVITRDNLGYRLSKIERNIRNNTAEVKEIQFVYSATLAATSVDINDFTSSLSQGTSEEERLGNRVRVKAVKYSVHSPNLALDILLVVSPEGRTPVAGDFCTQIMTEVLRTSSDDHKIVKRIRNFGSTGQYMHGTKRWKNGLPVHWQDSGALSVNKNRISMVVSNMTANPITFAYIVTVYFSDA